jgi:hypothetical protein
MCYVNLIEMCYYTGFSSSMRDKMGPNGDIFKTKYDLKKRGIKSTKLEMIR